MGSRVESVGRVELHFSESAGPRPVVLFVHGPVPAAAVRPAKWPVYLGYCRLAAARGLAAATADLDYVDYTDVASVVAQLAAELEDVRAHPLVDGERVALWAFSGGGLLVNRWLEVPPAWLRCVALSYPVLQPPPDFVSTPIVLTRVGRERADIQETVDRLLASSTPVERIDVPGGRHAFDFLDDSDESRAAVRQALDSVSGHLF